MKKLLFLLLGMGLLAAKDDVAAKPPKPRFPLGKETTYVTKPLDAEGYIDYAAALNEHWRRGVTPANNANVLLWKAFGPRPEGGPPMPEEFFKWLEIKSPPEKGDYFIPLRRYLRNRRHVDAFQEKDVREINAELERCASQPWKASEHPDIAAWLKANEKSLTVVLKATQRTHYYSPLVRKKTKKRSSPLQNALIPGVQSCRGLAVTLKARAMLHIGEGRFDGAWQDLLACHRLGRLVAHGATLIDLLVGVAIDTIAANADLVFLERIDGKAEQINNYLRDLQQLPSMPSVADKIDLGERFLFLDGIVMVDRYGSEALDDLAGTASAKGSNLIENFFFRLAIDWEPALRIGNRCFDRLTKALRIEDRGKRGKELGQIVAELDDLNKKTKKSSNRKVTGENIATIWMGLLIPSLANGQNASDRDKQIQNNLYLAFALAAYHRDHGRYPKELTALAPKYLDKIPNDIFAGKPLVYRPSANGYLLYSVGVNGRDEEGHSGDDAPPGDDLSVHMPPLKLKQK